MLIYQYFCPQCQKQREVEMKMSEVGKKEVLCPECKRKMERIYTFNANIKKEKSCPTCPTGSCPFLRK